MSQAKVLLARERYGEALALLGQLLGDEDEGGSKDYFFQSESDETNFLSLKAEARRLIGSMPPKGRELYELHYGAEARRILDKAVAEGDKDLLSKASRCYFHTEAGYEATLLLGMHHIDRAQPLSGALLLDRVRQECPNAGRFEPALSLSLATGWMQAGMPEKARQTLSLLKRQHPEVEVIVAGKKQPLFKVDVEAVTWLSGLIGPQSLESKQAEAWAMFRGNAARNAKTKASAPLLNLRWNVRVFDSRVIETSLEQLRRAEKERGRTALSGLHPLAVDDVILMRTCQELLALDFNTGKRLWQTPVGSDSFFKKDDGDLKKLLASNRYLLSSIGNRVWADAVYGTLTSDGELVFSVEDLDISPNGQYQAAPFGGVIRVGGNGNAAVLPSNRLTAHDIRTGKLKWHLGGPKGDRDFPEAGTFFLGPPLPLMGNVYAIGETEGEIRLLAIDAKKEKDNVLWKQPLAVVERDVNGDPIRRMAGASPSYAAGILICPTSNGAVVAVDMATRSLLWGYRYPKNETNSRSVIIAMQTGQYPGGSSSRWIDATATIVGGRVLITPVESNAIYCVNLVDGKLVWSAARENDLYVAAADDEKVVLVGSREVRALKMSDGKPAWNGDKVAFPAGASPSGQGFASGDEYFVPLNSAEVVAVDLNKGKITHKAKSRKGDIPGNMICYKGRVISQGFDGLASFYQLDSAIGEVEKRLAANPDDAVALALQGEVLLDSQKRSEAIVRFRRSYELDESLRTRELLRDAMLEGLQFEFAKHRGMSAELEKLLDTPQQTAFYLRLMASGLRNSKEWAEATDRYMELVALTPGERGLEEIDKAHLVRRDRWIRTQLTEMRGEIGNVQDSPLGAVVRKEFNDALKSNDAAKLRRFLDYFAGQDGADEVKANLVAILEKENKKLESELLKGGLDEIEVSRDVRAIWDTKYTKVEEKSTNSSSASYYGQIGMLFEGKRGPFFADTNIRFNRASSSKTGITAEGPLGNDLWTVPLRPKGQSYPYYGASQIQVHGHLMLMNIGNNLIAIDTLGVEEKHTPRVLWELDMTALDALAGSANGNLQAGIGVPIIALNISSRYGTTARAVGPLNERYTVFQRYRNIIALDPMSGEKLWQRGDMPTDCILFGDEEFVFALPPGQQEAMVFDAADGRSLGKRSVPQSETLPLGTSGVVNVMPYPSQPSSVYVIGRNVLVWRRDKSGKKRTLELFDPWKQSTIWASKEFSESAKMSIVEDEVAGIFEEDGKFQLMSLADGKVMAEHKLEPEKKLQEITLMRLADQFFLITHTDPGDIWQGAHPQSMYGTLYKVVKKGRAYAFDMKGKAMWEKPAEIAKQYILINQPSGLPVLVFASRVYDSTVKDSKMRHQASVLMIDKRDGKKLYDESFAATNNMLSMRGDEANKEVVLDMYRKTLKLKFTDDPPPEPPPTKPKTTTGSLWQAIGKAIGETDR